MVPVQPEAIGCQGRQATWYRESRGDDHGYGESSQGAREGEGVTVSWAYDGATDDCVTVAQLIAELQAMPQDAPVVVEGCDCYGRCTGAEAQPAHRFEWNFSATEKRSKDVPRCVIIRR